MLPLNRRALGALILALPASAALAHHDVTKGDLVIGHPWTRAAGANANGAGFMTLKNNGSAGDRLLSAASPAARRLSAGLGAGRLRPLRARRSCPGS